MRVDIVIVILHKLTKRHEKISAYQNNNKKLMNVIMKYTYIPFSQKNECLSEHCLSFHLPILDISTQSFLPLNLSNVSQVRIRTLSFPITTHNIK